MSLQEDFSNWYNRVTGVNTSRRVYGRIRKIVPRDLERLEQKLGISLPHTYREFLLAGGDANPDHNTCDVSLHEDDNRILYSFTVRKFLALGPGGAEELARSYKAFQEQLPERMMPIAFDRFRNIMCIQLGTGVVYFWDVQALVEESRRNPNRHNLYQVAPNFEKFLEKLYRQNKYL